MAHAIGICDQGDGTRKFVLIDEGLKLRSDGWRCVLSNEPGRNEEGEKKGNFMKSIQISRKLW